MASLVETMATWVIQTTRRFPLETRGSIHWIAAGLGSPMRFPHPTGVGLQLPVQFRNQGFVFKTQFDII